MCGRFALYSDEELIKQRFNLKTYVPTHKSYNIPPGADVAAIRAEEAGNGMFNAHWGLIPSWAKDKCLSYKMINARIETIFEKPSYKRAIQQRRCIIPANGYYEWKLEKDEKQPYYVAAKDKSLLAFAGIFEIWHSPETGELIESCSIITEAANSILNDLHDRKPLMLKPEYFSKWLDRSVKPKELLLQDLHFSETDLIFGKVTRTMNKPSFNNPSCIDYIDS